MLRRFRRQHSAAGRSCFDQLASTSHVPLAEIPPNRAGALVDLLFSVFG